MSDDYKGTGTLHVVTMSRPVNTPGAAVPGAKGDCAHGRRLAEDCPLCEADAKINPGPFPHLTTLRRLK